MDPPITELPRIFNGQCYRRCYRRYMTPSGAIKPHRIDPVPPLKEMLAPDMPHDMTRQEARPVVFRGVPHHEDLGVGHCTDADGRCPLPSALDMTHRTICAATSLPGR